jgi:hypothetical protein
MEFEITFSDDLLYVVVTTSGPAALEGFAAYLEALVSDPRWRPGRDVLSDQSRLDARSLTAAEIESILELHLRYAEAIGPGLSAIVTGSPLKFGLARMFEAQGQDALPFRMRIFATVEKAEAWLLEEGGR